MKPQKSKIIDPDDWLETKTSNTFLQTSKTTQKP